MRLRVTDLVKGGLYWNTSIILKLDFLIRLMVGILAFDGTDDWICENSRS